MLQIIKRLHFDLRVLPLLLCLLLAACQPKTKTDGVHPAVVAYTGGTISILAPVRVVLTDDVPIKPAIGETVDADVFSFSPSVKGVARRIDENIFEFTVDGSFKPAQEYTVKFKIGDVADVGSAPSTFTFTMRTIAPTFTAHVDGLTLYNQRTPNLYYVKGVIVTSDYVEQDKVEKLMKVVCDKQKLSPKWSHEVAEKRHEFVIDSIRATSERYDVVLEFDGSPIDWKFDDKNVVKVPSNSEFSVADVNVVQTAEEQYIQCTFSDVLASKQRFEDYITLEGGPDAALRFSVDLNILKIFPSSRTTGVFTLSIAKGLKSNSGKTLQEAYSSKILFKQLDPTVKFVGRGVILPSSEGLFLNFQAVNYSAVEVLVYRIYASNVLQFLQVNDLNGSHQMRRVARQVASKTIQLSSQNRLNLSSWHNYSLDLGEIIKPEPGAIYRVKIRGVGKLRPDVSSNSDYFADDDYDSYYDDDYYSSSTYNDRSRNILATNIGLTAKRGDDNSVFVAASDLLTVAPLSGVQIFAYNNVNQKVGEANTDGDGFAILKCAERASVIVAQQGEQRSYLKLDKSLSLSNFDVSGTENVNGVKGFIYGERGVWRPGDTIFLAFMLEDKMKTLPENHPVTFSLYNPNNQLVTKQIKTSGADGLYLFTAATSSDALTGTWYARIDVGGRYFEKQLKVETVKPNRLKIEMKMDHTPFLSDEGMSGKMSVHWLHGAPAGNLAVRINARFSRMATTFPKFEDYTFEDRSLYFAPDEKTMLEAKLDAEGDLSFHENFDLNESPGMVRVFLSTRVFEEGGDFSINEFVTSYSPYSSYVGLRTPTGEGYYNRLELDQEQVFKVATVSESGKPVSRQGIKVEIFNVGWRWWWSSVDGDASYTSGSYRSPVFSTTVNTTNGKGEFRHKWSRSGYYIVRLTDPESGHVTAAPVYASYPYWYDSENSGDGNNGASLLLLTTDKPKYNVGEEAVVNFPSAKGARAMVSIEAGNRILRTFWADCDGTEGKVVIKTTADMTPNVYAHISLIQPHARTTNDAPIRLYGVVPLFVEDPMTRLVPQIAMPEVLKPEETFTVKVSEKNGQPMSYTLAVVDDGLLDLTNFKTPDPWASFFAREALGVVTWDIFDYVIGAYGGKIESVFAIGGGDEGGAPEEKQQAQRFKPVVRYLGPFTLDKGKTDEHKITMPPYVGSVRTMVVATNGHAFGAAEKTTPVRKALMTLATMPRVVGPGEEVWLPVTVFAMEDKIKQVSVEVETNKLFTVEGSNKQNIAFSGTGDQTVYFRLKVKEQTGVGKISAKVSSNGEKASNDIELEVRNPNPTVYTFAETLVNPGRSWEGAYTLPGMSGTNKATLEAAYLPPINLGRRLNYLIQYPHGCIEQTTSSVFPQLYLGEVTELSPKMKADIEENIKQGLNRLLRFVTPQGGFGYWPGDYTPSSWGSSYAGQFMLEAESKGYALPAGLKQSWLRYQANRAANWRSNEGEVFGQAYRLYTLALAKQADLSAMNRLKEYPNLSNATRWRLAAAYSIAGKDETAKALIKEASTNGDSYANRFDYSYGTPERDQAMILETLTQLGDRIKGFELVQKISNALNSKEWMSTQTTAYCLMAVAKYAAGEKGDKSIKIEYSDATGKKQKAESKEPFWQADLNVPATKTGDDKVSLTNKGEVPLFVRVTASGIPLPGHEEANAHGLEISVRFIDSKGVSLDVSRLPQGTDFKAEVTVKNPAGSEYYTNMALTEIFPSGWEIVNTRLNDGTTDTGSSQYAYMDIRDDRVYTYFGLSANKAVTYIVPLSATYRGRFYLPAFICEAMYDETIKANSEGKWIEVIEK